jgi:hypothetical protein
MEELKRDYEIAKLRLYDLLGASSDNYSRTIDMEVVRAKVDMLVKVEINMLNLRKEEELESH